MSGIYTSFAQSMLTGAVNWPTASVAVMLVGTGYTPNYGSDSTLANIPAGAQLLTAPLAVSSPTVVGGFAQAAGAAWTSLTTASAVKGVAVLMLVGATYNLVCYLDQGSGFGQTATAVPANIVWDNRGIFQP